MHYFNTYAAQWRIPLLVVLIFGIFSPLTAQMTYTVTNTSPTVTTVGGFTWAIDQANNDGVASTINVTVAGTMTPAATLTITEPVTINGTSTGGVPNFILSGTGILLRTTGTRTGLTITNLGFYGTITNDGNNRAIDVDNWSEVEISNCNFEQIRRSAIEVTNGSDVTITNNEFVSCGGAAGGYIITVASVTNAAGDRLTMTGNTFSGGANAVSLAGMDGLAIANAGLTEVLLPDNDGRTTVTGTNLQLTSSANVTIDGFDLSFENGANGINGTGLNTNFCANLTVNNLTVDRRQNGIIVSNSETVSVTGNTLSNVNTTGIRVSAGSNATVTTNSFTSSGGAGNRYNLELLGVQEVGGSRLAVSGNTFSGGANAVWLDNMDGVTIATSGSPEVLLPDTDGRKTVAGANLQVINSANVTIDGFDLSFDNGANGISGVGLNTNFCANLTVNNLTVDRRQNGIIVSNSETVSVTGNILSNVNTTGIRVSAGSNATVTTNSFTSSGGAGNRYNLELLGVQEVGGSRLAVSGNTFSGGANAVWIDNMDGVTIATSGSPEVLLPDTDGRKTVAGANLQVISSANVTIDGFDLSFDNGANGISGVGLNTNLCANLTVNNLTVDRRQNGIIVGNSETVSVTNNAVSNASSVGIRVSAGSNATVTTNSFTSSGGAGNRYNLELLGVQEVGGSRLDVSGNTFSGGANAVWLENMDGVTVNSVAPAEVILADDDGRTSVTGTNLRLQSSANTTLTDLDLSYNGTGPNGTGLYGVSCSNLSVSGATITDRSIGVLLDNCVSPSVLDNTLTNNTTKGIWIRNGENATVTGNALTNCGGGFNNGSLHFESIAADVENMRLEASGNSFTDCNGGVYVNNMPGIIVSDGSVAGTEITITAADQIGPFGQTAVEIVGSENARVEGLTLKAPNENVGNLQGIRAIGCSGVVITGNSVRGRTYAMSVLLGAAVTSSPMVSGNLLEANTFGLYVDMRSTDASVMVTGNNFVCNTTGITALRDADVDASGNFWGDAGGSATDSGNGDTYQVSNNAVINNTTTFSPTPIAGVATLAIAQIAATGNAAAITDGQTATAVADHTDFGDVFTGATLIRTFTISNAGTDELTISDITVAGDAAFTIGAGAPTTVAGGGTATFDVVYAPTVAGAATATTVTVAHDACQDDDGEFSFAVGGLAIASCDITIASATPTDEGCPDANDGAITVNASCTSCTGGIIYTISPNAGTLTGNVFSDLPDGTYTVTATDAGDGSCTVSETGVVVAAGMDTEAPNIICPDPVTISTDPNSPEAGDPDLGTATITDNCDADIDPAINSGADLPLFYIGERGGNFSSLDLDGNRAIVAPLAAADGVLFLNSTTALVSRFANTGDKVLRVDLTDGTVTPLIQTPGVIQGMSLDTDGNVLITNEGQRKIQKLDLTTLALTDVVTTGLARPIDVVLDGPDALLISEFGGGGIKRFDRTTGVLTTVSTGHSNATDIFYTSDGRLLVAENSGAISIVDLTQPASSARTQLVSISGGPHGIAEDFEGNIYVSLFNGGKVVKVDATTNAVTDFATGYGNPVFIARRPQTILTLGSNTVTYTATDDSGNSNNCTQMVMVTDTEAPGVPVLNPVNEQCSATITAPVAFDNVDGEVTGTTPTVISSPLTESTTITWTFTDAAGNSSMADQTVTVADTEAPTFTCPPTGEITLDLCGETTISPVDLGLIVTDNCVADPTVTLSPTDLTGVGTTNVTVTVSDGTNSDNSCVIAVTTVENPNAFSIATDDEDLGDQCLGTPLIISAATLLDGDNASDGRTIEVQDITLINPAQGSVVNNNDGTFTFTPAAGVSGAVAFEYLVTAEGDDLFFSDNGHYYKYFEANQISWTAAKAAAEDQMLFGMSGYLPTITSQTENDFILERLGGNAWIGASDEETEGTWKWVTGPEAGQIFWIGLSNGSAQNGFFTNWHPLNPSDSDSGEDYGMILDDPNVEGLWNDWPNVFPTITGYVAEFGGLSSCLPALTATGNISLNLVDGDAPATPTLVELTDECSVTVVAPTTTDICAGTITGTTSTDISAPLTASTTITWTFTDGTNSIDVDQTVTIADVTSAVAACNTTVELSLDTETVTLTADDLDNGSSDNCGATPTLTITDGQTVFGCDDIGEAAVTVTLSASDGTNAPTTCTAEVTVVAGTFSCNSAPTLTCAPVTVDADGNCMGAAAGADFVLTSNDLDGDDLTFSVSPEGPYELGETDVVVTVSDGALSNSCSTTITVVDATDPTITCPDPIAVNVDAGVCGAVVDYDILFDDNCAAGNGVATASKNVLILYDNIQANTPSLVSAIEAAGHTVSLSFEASYDGTNPSLTSFDVVIHLDGLTWSSVMPEAGQAALLDFVINQNKTYVATEFVAWTNWDNVNSHATLTEILPLEVVNFSADGPLNYVTVAGQEGHPVLNGVAATISLPAHRAYETVVRTFAQNPAVALMTSTQGAAVAVREFPDGGRAVGFQYAPNNFSSTVLTTSEAQALMINVIQWQAGLNLSQDNGLASGEVFPVGTTTNDYTVTDGAGNTADCSFTVTVTDNEAPVANCEANFTVILDVNGEAPLTAADLDNATTPSADNCTLTLSIDGGDLTYDCDDVDQTFTLTLIADDGNVDSGNGTCTVDVTVTDPNNVCYTCDLGFSVEDEDNGIPPGIITSRIVCGNDGAITVNAFCNGCDDGNSDLVYSINGTDFQPGNTFTGLTEGDYTVTIRDADNTDCFTTVVATIGECVGEIPGNSIDDDCDTETDEASSVAWILLDGSETNATCTSSTDCCAQTFCYGLEYTPQVSGILTSYTTGFLMPCIDGATPLISNASCVMTDNSFDAADCAGGNGAFFNSSGNSGGAVMFELTKEVPVILHQICLTIPDEQMIDIMEDAITDISMSITVTPVLSTDETLRVTDLPEYNTLTASGNQRPVVVSTGPIDDCYLTLADAEAAALAATSATDDCTSVSAPQLTVATVGTCSAVITVTATDQCGLTTDVIYNTRIDGDAATITGTLEPIEVEACVASDVPAATNVAELEALGAAGFDVTDNCTLDEDLVVTFADASQGSCPVIVTRTYTITDECNRSTTVVQELTLNDTTAPEVTGILTTTTIDGCDMEAAPTAVTTISELELLAGNLNVDDACTEDVDIVVTHEESINDACPRLMTRIYTLTDLCGNATQVDQQFIVQDLEVPTSTGTLEAVTIEGCDATAAPSAVTTIADLEALAGDLDVMDNCTDDADLQLTHVDAEEAGVCPAKTIVTRTYTVTDRCNNSSTVVRMITIEDTTMPEVVGTLDFADAEGCDASAAPVAATTVAELELMAGGVQISDACTVNGDLAVSHSDASVAGACPNVLVITRTYTVMDACDNASTLTQTINITDTTDPSVTGAPELTTVEGCDATVAPAAVTTVADLEGLGTGFDIFDACTTNAALVVTHNDISEAGTCPVKLIITRTYTITDACGNDVTVDHIIEVEDNTAPELTLGTLPTNCYADRAAAEQAAIDATSSSDNCSGDVTLTVTSTGTCPATITVTGADICGNTASVDYENVIITNGAIPTEIDGPAATGMDIQTELDVVEPTPPSFEDVCGNTLTAVGPVVVDNYTTGDCRGTVTYTWTYTDCSGTETTWTFTYNIDCLGLNIRVFTEGTYDAGTGMLSTFLNENHLLPGQDKNLSPILSTRLFADYSDAGHPYQSAPWFYSGHTGEGYGDVSAPGATGSELAYPDHVADWVIVTVRKDGMLPANDVWTCSGWLHETGEVTFPESCPISLEAGSTYHIIVEHRNHLPVMAEATLAADGSHITRDFTTANSYAPIFRSGQKPQADGAWAMLTGNAEQVSSRTSINSADRTTWSILQNLRGYYFGDFDQSGQVESFDETLWKNNQNRTSGIRFD